MKYQQLYNQVQEFPGQVDADSYWNKDKAAGLRIRNAGLLPTNNETLNRAVAKLGLRITYPIPYADGRSPQTDMRSGAIELPHPDSFGSADEYTHVVLHEVCHSLAVRLRQYDLDPFSLDMFFRDGYAEEEIAAEMAASLFEQATTGKLATPGGSYSYLRGFLNRASFYAGDSKKEVWERAEGKAQSRVDLLLEAGK